MLTIPISHDVARSCVDDIVVAIANWYECEHVLMFSESWEFVFDKTEIKPNEAIGKHILPVDNRRHQLVGKYHGLNLKLQKPDNFEQLINIIKHELSNERPIAVYIDTYWCPWFKNGYQEYYYPHYCIVVGINEEKQVLYCIDGQLATTATELPFDIYKKGCGDYITFTHIKDYKCDIDWKAIISNAIERTGYPNRSDNMFSNMKELGYYIKDNLDLKKELEGFEKHPTNAAFFRQIFKVSKGRKQFSTVLKYLAEKYSIAELDYLSDKMKMLGDTWSSIFGMLVKGAYIKDSYQLINRVADKIIEISDIEKEFAGDLAKVVSSTYTQKPISSPDKQTSYKDAAYTDFHFINLEPYFNNNGISNLLTPECTAELSNVGRYLLAEGLPQNNQWKVDNMMFDFPEIAENKFDNLSCNGEKIILSDNKIYSSIMFLGCAELGNHFEKVLIEYEDGTNESVPIEFTTWLSDKIEFGERIAWRGKAAVRSIFGVDIYPFPGNIFAKSYCLEKRNRIKSITMPACPNIHVFAITLGI